MKPDQHKKKRSAQYKRKHNIAQKKEADKSTKAADPQTSSSKTPSPAAISAKATATGPAESTSSQKSLTLNKDFTQDESEEVKQFSRRKIESNWDRYEPLDDDGDESFSYDGLKGADFKALLSQTGDASSQFRFKDEQLWDNEDSDISKDQGPEGFPGIDCHELSQRLMAIPLPVRLNIDNTFFESSMLKCFDEIASRHKEKLDTAPSRKNLVPGSESEVSVVFTASTQVLDVNTNETTEDSIIFPDSEDDEANTERNQPKEDERQYPNDSPISLLEDKAEQTPDLGETIGCQNFSHMEDVPKAADIPVTEDEVTRCFPESQYLDDVVDSKENILEPKTSLCKDNKPSHLLEKTSELPSNQQENQSLRTTPPAFSESSVVSPPHQALKSTNLKPNAADAEDELDFLLSLENPVQIRSKPDKSGQFEEEESDVTEGLENPPSEPKNAEMKFKKLETPSNSASSTQNSSDNLEDWLDSMLID